MEELVKPYHEDREKDLPPYHELPLKKYAASLELLAREIRYADLEFL
jgi:hypothetical protein